MFLELFDVWTKNAAIDLARYIFIATPAFAFFWIWRREHFRPRFIWGRLGPVEKMVHDFWWSMSTVIVFSIHGVALHYGARSGCFRRYAQVADYGWGYFIFTIVALIVVQDTYFYWTHRAMHTRALYRLFHRVHHVSTTASPWTSYAFTPFEALTHAVFVPMLWSVMPMHEGALFVFLIFMTSRNVVGHLSIEIFPKRFVESRLGRWSTTVTHHALHHKYFATNFGLYFSFWDRVMGTEHADYQRELERVYSARTSIESSSELKLSPPLYPK